jgi:hypothetical protein
MKSKGRKFSVIPSSGFSFRSKLILPAMAFLIATACGGVKDGDYYPEDRMGDNDSTMQTAGAAPDDDRLFSNMGIFGGGGSKKSASSGLGINSYLWRASLDTLAFMPLTTVDSTGGVIITDWYANPQVPTERFKLTVYILDTRLRADGVKVSVFRQEKAEGTETWQDAIVATRTAIQLENQILRRARELKVGAGQ